MEGVGDACNGQEFNAVSLRGKPQGALNDITAIVNSQAAGSSIHIAPFNTKLSCLATYALWLDRRQIRIWNALPETYNLRGYSRGGTKPRYFDVDWNAGRALEPPQG